MAIEIPLSINPLAKAITKGVFPVPPTVILPTLMTGHGRVFVLNSLREWKRDLAPTAHP